MRLILLRGLLFGVIVFDVSGAVVGVIIFGVSGAVVWCSYIWSIWCCYSVQLILCCCLPVAYIALSYAYCYR